MRQIGDDARSRLRRQAAVFVKRAGIREQLLAGGAIGGRHDEGRGVTLKE
jgi:hypothetical protein